MQKSQEVQKDSSKLHYSKLYKQGSDRTRISGGASNSWTWRIHWCRAYEKARGYLYVWLVPHSFAEADLGEFEMADEELLDVYVAMIAGYVKTDKMAAAILERSDVDDEFRTFLAALYKALELQRKISKEKKGK
jgi:hypothetical protein